MTKYFLRFRRRLLLALAVLPLCQAAGTCDQQVADAFVAQFTQSVSVLILQAAQQVLLQSFPSADILQTFIGGQPFIQ